MLLSLEEVTQARDSQQGLIAELRYELGQRKEEEETLRSQASAAIADLEEEKKSVNVTESLMNRMKAENAELVVKCEQLLQQITALCEQIDR